MDDLKWVESISLSEVLAMPECAPGYRIGRDGSVWSTRWRKPKRLIQTPAKCGGYLTVKLPRDGKWVTSHVHVLVATAYRGPKPYPESQVRHLDGNPRNNHVDNLRWGTAKENGQDRVAHGRTLRGELRPQAKLTEEQAREIRELPRHSKGVAEMYGVSKQTVCDIRKGRRWRHLV